MSSDYQISSLRSLLVEEQLLAKSLLSVDSQSHGLSGISPSYLHLKYSTYARRSRSPRDHKLNYSIHINGDAAAPTVILFISQEFRSKTRHEKGATIQSQRTVALSSSCFVGHNLVLWSK
ncbi:hypothetical protein VTN31DRAFT_6971 [Thermomyces dupontii]|uniref:uncharacterized protein n=1 Tax=Talaromyces thermophilus TaxID=28565 RepID=UPI0037428E35